MNVQLLKEQVSTCKYSWAIHLHCGVEHTVLCISFIYIKDTV